MVWRGAKSFGDQADIFTGNFPDGQLPSASRCCKDQLATVPAWAACSSRLHACIMRAMQPLSCHLDAVCGQLVGTGAMYFNGMMVQAYCPSHASPCM